MCQIKETTREDINRLVQVHTEAFGPEEGPEIAGLVAALLKDPSARPRTSLLACEGERALGHILFTHVALSGHEETVAASLLCPLAVVPEAQSQGVGGKLIKAGLAALKEAGVGLVFVLGHPDYYPRYGFSPAGSAGLYAPYPIAEKNAGAWMVQALRPGLIGQVKGTLSCARALQDPAYWQE